MVLSRNTKGVLSIIAGVLTHLILGSVYSFGLLNPYLISYLKQFNSSIEVDSGFFLLPLAVISTCFSFPYGGYLGKVYGPRLPMLIGQLIVCTCYVILYFSKVLFINYFCTAMIGVGNGFCYISPIRTGWLYFPKSRGIVIGIIVCGFGLSSSIVTLLVKEIVNPNEITSDKHGLYPEEVYKNVPAYFLTLLCSFIVLSVVSLTLIQRFYETESDYEENKEDNLLDKTLEDRIVYDEKKNELIIEKDDLLYSSDVLSDGGDTVNDKKTINNNHYVIDEKGNRICHVADEIKVTENTSVVVKTVKLRKAIFSRNNILLFFIGMCSYYLPSSIINTFKTFTNNFKDELDENLINWLSIFIYLGNGLFRTMWGFLYDKFGFKKIMFIVLVLNVICSSVFYFIVTIKPLLIIFCVVVSSLAGAPFALLPTAVQEIYGIKYYSEVYGGTFYCFGISALLVPIICKMIGLGHATTTSPYIIVYSTGGVLSAIALVLVLCLKMDKYVYRYY